MHSVGARLDPEEGRRTERHLIQRSESPLEGREQGRPQATNSSVTAATSDCTSLPAASPSRR